MLRRLAAVLMLLTIAFSQMETVMGVLRDGKVHHDSAATAALHALNGQGEHGHEDGAPHGPKHEHGTPADHCTHQHGAQVNQRAPELAILEHVFSTAFLEPLLWRDRFTEPFSPPPQA
ncbi:MAG: hypothetical protein GEU90_16805 [Gemmatimonas sp.]|nr:hypothetical protein [Gemmatimonas sp.]